MLSAGAPCSIDDSWLELNVKVMRVCTVRAAHRSSTQCVLAAARGRDGIAQPPSCRILFPVLREIARD
ncbi:hypothetical protein MTO96_011341 [Rhipicephalus appendiculatus]